MDRTWESAMSLPRTRLNYYEVLGVAEDASQAQIKRGYRNKVRECHPDLGARNGSAGHFLLVQRAYEVLGNPAERERYDTINALGAHAGQPRIYRRSFNRLFDSLLNNLSMAFHASLGQADRRKAG
jgi:curved DNA-binding protein CbpA